MISKRMNVIEGAALRISAATLTCEPSLRLAGSGRVSPALGVSDLGSLVSAVSNHASSDSTLSQLSSVMLLLLLLILLVLWNT